MNPISIWAIFISFFLLLHVTNSVEDEVKNSLISFLAKLSNNVQFDPSFGWNSTSDPCMNKWHGVVCSGRHNAFVTRLDLKMLNLAGTLDAASLCDTKSIAKSLTYLVLDGNNLGGGIPAEIASCNQLARLQVSGNRFSGSLPASLTMLSNLKRLDVSNNNFSGNLPDMSRISGLTRFLVQNNQLSGEIPELNFPNLEYFNFSFNNFSGHIPNAGSHVDETSFLGNPELCGDPLPKKCPSLPQKGEDTSKGGSKDQTLLYSGYIVLASAAVILIIFRLCRRKKSDEEKVDAVNKVAAVNENSISKLTSISSGEYKMGVNRSEYSGASSESAYGSSSLVVLSSPEVNGLRFEDLLTAPAELLGRGSHGTLYKVMFQNRMVLVVKRIKDWAISSNDFKQRMQKIGQVKHPNVVPALAFYCSKHEKLLVYEFQQNGSLFRLLRGTQVGQSFDWASRLGVAASIAEALAFMHHELQEDGIAHVDNQDTSSSSSSASSARAFKADIYGFGVILLELLTGRLAQNNGVDLAEWVHSVVREEWTVEVFDKSQISEGVSEERMVNLLQVAIRCVNPSPEARPSINQVAVMINTVREEDERSLIGF